LKLCFLTPDKSTWKKINKAFSQFNKSGTGTPEQNTSDNVFGEGGLSQVSLQELLLFDFEKLATATNNFHLSNKLGQGGFGPVYKVLSIHTIMSETIVCRTCFC
jgi:hypothetical protein